MSFWSNLTGFVNVKLDEAIQKAESNIGDFKKKDGENVQRKASLTDPTVLTMAGAAGSYRPRYSHISTKTLKEMSLRDPIIASIIQCRTNQMVNFSRPQETKYDTGYKITPRDPSLEIKKGSIEESEIQFLNDYILRTGLEEGRDDKDKVNFETFLKLETGDRYRYGHIALERLPTKDKKLHSFYAVPGESIYYANKQMDARVLQNLVANEQEAIKWLDDTKGKSDTNKNRYDIKKFEQGEYDYVQMGDNGKVIQAFTREELVFKLGNPQNFMDLNGYALGELELSTNMVTAHLNIENYNKLFFQQGFVAKGLLHIQGDVPPQELQLFRAQWAAQVAGNSASWRTPIIAGVDEIKWIPLSMSNKDMEFQFYVDHIVRTICSIFQISPIEIGFDHLSKGSGQNALAESNNEWKIKFSQDKGLKPLLVWFETIINDEIMPYIDGNGTLAKKYKFEFVGYDAESKEQERARHQVEIGLHSSINDIRKDLAKDPIQGANILLNPAFLDVLWKTHTIGEIREFYMGKDDPYYAGDSKKPEYGFILAVSQPMQEVLMATLGSTPPSQQLALEAQEMNMQMMTAGGMQGQPGQGQQGQEKDEGRKPQNKVEKVVGEYLENHPDLLEKAIKNAPKTKKIEEEMEIMRDKMLSSFEKVQDQMVKDILAQVIEDGDADSNTK